MNDLTALYAACRRCPEDDAVRLALADCLDEQSAWVPCPTCKGTGEGIKLNGSGSAWKPCVCGGLGEVRVNLNSVRAELCRVQVELSRVPEEPPKCSPVRIGGRVEREHYHFCRWCQWVNETRPRRDELVTRESAILRDHAAALLPACPACGGNGISGGGDDDLPCLHCSGSGRVGSYHRGLLTLPVPTLGTVLAQQEDTCPDCRRLGSNCPTHGANWGTVRVWQLTPYAAGLLARHPDVERVEVGDKDPLTRTIRGKERAFWEPGLNYELHHRLPFWLCEKAGWKSDVWGGLMVYAFDSPDLARDALARAVAVAMWSMLSPSPATVAAGAQ